jgi:hypothetical protein
MKTYDVTITATITKTIRVTADYEEEAAEIAHNLFTVECDGDEKYAEDMENIVEVEEPK